MENIIIFNPRAPTVQVASITVHHWSNAKPSPASSAFTAPRAGSLEPRAPYWRMSDASNVDSQRMQRCAELARQLEAAPTDHRLMLEFRMAVDSYAGELKASAAGGGISAAALYGVADADAARCTVDLDLRFLGREALAVQAKQLHASVESSSASGMGERAALMQAIMRSRAANTGYMASAPPTQTLEHFFDLTKRSGGLYGRLARRMLWIDNAQQEFTLIHKEEETKAYSFTSLSRIDPIENGARLTLAGSRGTEVLTLHSTSEIGRAHV